MSEPTKFKVTIWGAFVPEFELIRTPDAVPDDSENVSVQVLSEENSSLWKEIYSWKMLEDPLGGIIEIGNRKKLKIELLESMDIEIHPSHRTIDSLKSSVGAANSILLESGVEWSGSQSTLTDDDEEIRINPLLALINHLSWLIDVFEGQPNISVSIR